MSFLLCVFVKVGMFTFDKTSKYETSYGKYEASHDPRS
jgi:hypothetical protein